MKMTPEQKQEKINKLLREKNLVILDKDDAVTVIEFVEELLNIEIEETKANEPYATNSIREMEEARRRVYSLTELFN